MKHCNQINNQRNQFLPDDNIQDNFSIQYVSVKRKIYFVSLFLNFIQHSEILFKKLNQYILHDKHERSFNLKQNQCKIIYFIKFQLFKQYLMKRGKIYHRKLQLSVQTLDQFINLKHMSSILFSWLKLKQFTYPKQMQSKKPQQSRVNNEISRVLSNRINNVIQSYNKSSRQQNIAQSVFYQNRNNNWSRKELTQADQQFQDLILRKLHTIESEIHTIKNGRSMIHCNSRQSISPFQRNNYSFHKFQQPYTHNLSNIQIQSNYESNYPTKLKYNISKNNYIENRSIYDQNNELKERKRKISTKGWKPRFNQHKIPLTITIQRINNKEGSFYDDRHSNHRIPLQSGSFRGTPINYLTPDYGTSIYKSNERFSIMTEQNQDVRQYSSKSKINEEIDKKMDLIKNLKYNKVIKRYN